MNNSDVFVTGTGSPEADLTPNDFAPIVAEALSGIPAGARVLAVSELLETHPA